MINRIREAGRHLVLFVIGVSFLSGLGYTFLRNTSRNANSAGPRSALVDSGTGLLLIFLGIILWELLQNGAGPSADWILDSGIGADPVSRLEGLEIIWLQNVDSAAVLVSAAAVVIPVRGFAVSESGSSKFLSI